MAKDKDFEAEEVDFPDFPESPTETEPLEVAEVEDLEDLFRPEPDPTPEPPTALKGKEWKRGEDGKLVQA